MENNKLQNGIDEIKEIKMTSFEKSHILESVLGSSIQNEKPVRSTWLVNPFVLMIKKNHLAYYVIIPLIVILSGGGIVFASNESLPSSIFYPIKVSVVEPIVGSLQFSPVAKAKYESGLATKRLVEAETLAKADKLDKTTEKRLDVLLDSHTVALNKALNEVSQTTSSDQVDEIVINFNAGMNAHARVLDIINGKESDTEVTQNTSIQISQTARDNAKDIKSVATNKEKKNKEGDKSEQYNKKKDAVQTLITQTMTDLNSVTTGATSRNQETIDNTNETLNEAKMYLNEADKNVEEGDSRSAYSNLLDSESSAVEAGIFLQTRNDEAKGN